MRRVPKHAVIVCHPVEHSFTMAVATRYCDTVRGLRQDVVLRDLYRMGFDPVLKATERPTASTHCLSDDVARELELLSGADVFVLVYPIWFGSPPALVKGYIDRVLGAGFPHGAIRDRRMHPLMTGKLLVSFTTSATTKAWLEEQGAWLSLRTLYDDYMRRAFSLEATEHIHFDAITDDLSRQAAEGLLFQVEQAARRICSRFVHSKQAGSSTTA